MQQVTVASDPSLNRGLEDGRRKDRALQRRTPVVKTFDEAIQMPMKPVERRHEPVVSEEDFPKRNVRSVRSNAVGGRLKQKQLRRRRNIEDSRHHEPQDAIEVHDHPEIIKNSGGERLQNLVNYLEQEETSRPLDRRRMSRQLRPLRQGGIAGVAYDDIYLAIGVAATALFIIETLYKTYQLYNSAGRSLADSSLLDLIEVWPLPSFSFHKA